MGDPVEAVPGSARSTDLVVRHTLLNVGGAVLPLLVAFVAVPRVLAGLGLERFGVLTLAISIVGYFGVFDLGLGRATTRYMAAALGSGDERLAAEYFWTALVMNTLLGLAGGVVLAAAAPFLARDVLKVSPGLVAEVTAALRTIALLVPVTIVTSTLVGSLEAQRRFALVNALQVPAATMVQLMPLLCLAFTRNAAVIIGSLVAVRALLAAATLGACLRSLPALRRPIHSRAGRLRELLGYGGWLTVTNVVGPLMVSGDRFVIGAVLSLGVVAYYATPYDVIMRLTVLSAALSRSLFPVFGASRPNEAERFVPLLVSATRILALLLTGALVPVIVLSHDLLRLWIDADFARHASPILVLLSVAVLISSLSYTPYTLLQGLGRPDLTAKFHLLELVVYVPLLFALLPRMGVAGAAVAWVVRVVLDAGLLMWAAVRLTDPGRRSPEWARLLPLAAAVGTALALAIAAALVPIGMGTRAGVAAALVSGLAIIAWRRMLATPERGWILKAGRRLVGAPS